MRVGASVPYLAQRGLNGNKIVPAPLLVQQPPSRDPWQRGFLMVTQGSTCNLSARRHVSRRLTS